jgi:hypothetical protein
MFLSGAVFQIYENAETPQWLQISPPAAGVKSQRKWRLRSGYVIREAVRGERWRTTARWMNHAPEGELLSRQQAGSPQPARARASLLPQKAEVPREAVGSQDLHRIYSQPLFQDRGIDRPKVYRELDIAVLIQIG